MDHAAHTCYLKEQAYLIARGVRPIALIGHCVANGLEMLKTATTLEAQTERGSIPFVVDRGNGVADYGYAASQWALELYQWVVCAAEDTVPSLRRHRILGLLLGYSVDAIGQHEEHMSGRRFHLPNASAVLREPGSNSQPACSPSKGEIYHPH